MKAVHSIYLTLICMTLTSPAIAGGHSSTAVSGQAVFEASCARCHDSFIGGMLSGAPQLGNQVDWSPIVPKGIDVLTQTTIAGIGKMDPRGACANCSDAEIRAAIEYILEQSQ